VMQFAEFRVLHHLMSLTRRSQESPTTKQHYRLIAQGFLLYRPTSARTGPLDSTAYGDLNNARTEKKRLPPSRFPMQASSSFGETTVSTVYSRYFACICDLDRMPILFRNTKATLSKDYGVDMAPGILSVAALLVIRSRLACQTLRTGWKQVSGGIRCKYPCTVSTLTLALRWILDY
jgi:hypothetical protein